jgi:hypothetical protein
VLVRILVGAGLFVLGYALGRATRPSVLVPGRHRSTRVSDMLAGQDQPAGVAQAADMPTAEAADDSSGKAQRSPPFPDR